MAEMMMVDRIVTDCDSCPVQRFLVCIWISSCIHCKEGLSDDSARLPVVRDERQFVGGRKDIVCKTEILHTQLSLNEIHKAEGKAFRLLESLFPILPAHLYDVQITVISIYRPVDHVSSFRGLSIRDHHFRRPYRLPCHIFDIQRILAAVIEWRRIITLRHFDRHVGIMAVILQEGHISQILYDIIRLLRCNRLPCIFRGFHTDPVVNSACLCYVTELCRIDNDIGPYAMLTATGVTI